MQFAITTQPQAQVQAVEQLPMPTWEDFFCDQMFTNYVCQDMFSDSPSQNASATAVHVSGVAGSSQAGGNMNKLHSSHTTPQLTDPYPQEQGYFPSEEFRENAEQRVPQIHDVYQQHQDDHAPPISIDQGNSSSQFAQSAGIAMANTNIPNIPDLYEQEFFASLEFPPQAQQPSNVDTFTIEQFRALFQSLDPQTREYIAAFPVGKEASKALAGDVSDLEIDEVFELRTTQPGGQGMNQSNLQWNQTANAHIPMANLASQSQEQWGYNAVNAQAQAQAQIQMQMQTPIPLISDVPFMPPDYSQEQQEEWKPDVVDYMEKSYGINIHPDDYNMFTRGQNLECSNLNKHNMNTPPENTPPEFVQGSSRKGANSFQHTNPHSTPSHQSKGALPKTTPSKRKRQDDDMAIKPRKPYRRRKTSPKSDPPGAPPSGTSTSSSPQTRSKIFSPENENLVDSFFEFQKDGKDYRCRYIQPYSGHVCPVVMSGGDKRNRYRHLTTHVQLEETQVADGQLDIANALLFMRLRKQVVECDIGECDFRVEVWRTDHVRKNHKKECHRNAYMDRIQRKGDRRGRRAKRVTDVESEWDLTSDEDWL